jgi:hypothetical protein
MTARKSKLLGGVATIIPEPSSEEMALATFRRMANRKLIATDPFTKKDKS